MARNIALRNPWLSLGELNFAIQKLIDRIIFMRIAEDRGTEPYGQLREAAIDQRLAPPYSALFDLFGRADDRYNSGLFHFHTEAGRASLADVVSSRLKIDDRPLQQVIRGLYYPESPYEFSVMPPEVLGRVYEKFLGKTIRLTSSHRAIIEEKPEVRLAGGVYYTPAYVIDYVVGRTLGRLLNRRRHQHIDGRSASRAFRVLDPACGSGSFLLGAYDYLLRWYRDSYIADDPDGHARGRPPRLYRTLAGQWRLTLAERKRILLTHIFGVDRDSQAVETTKLSLLLKVLEGARDHLLSQQLEIFQERVPDLDSNIKCGNSVVESDVHTNRQGTLDYDAAEALRPFDWNYQFSKAMSQGGFNIVLGNPPYVRIQRIPHVESDYLFRKYTSLTGKTDLSVVFVERALQLCRPEGLIGFICTSQWTTTDYGRNLRGMLAGGKLHEVLNFGSLPVFQDAETYPAIFIIGHKEHDAVELREITVPEDLRVEALNSAPTTLMPRSRLTSRPWNLKPFDLFEHVERKRLATVRSGTLAAAAIGDLTGMDRVFVLSADEARELACDIVLPYASRGAAVRPFHDTAINKWVIYPYRPDKTGRPVLLPEAELRTKYPAVYHYLRHRRDELRQRMDSRRYYAAGADWYRHLRPVDLLPDPVGETDNERNRPPQYRGPASRRRRFQWGKCAGARARRRR